MTMVVEQTNRMTLQELAAKSGYEDPSGFPDWFKKIRRSAWDQFKKKGFPNRQDENWKYLSLSEILDTSFEFTEEGYEVKNEEGSSKASVLTLREGFERFEGVLKELFHEISLMEQNAFSLINTFRFNDGIFIHVPAQTVLKNPLTVRLGCKGSQGLGAISHPRVVVWVGDNARLNLVFECGEMPNASQVMNAVSLVKMGKNAHLNWVFLGRQDHQATLFSNTAASIGRDSALKYFVLDGGADLSRHEINVKLKGENASVSLSSLMALTGDEQSFHHVFVEHEAPHTESQQNYKSILTGNAVSEYNSLVHARHEAIKTVSSQLNKNLLLSETARAYSRPQLKIDTDDVQCSHGATMGQLDLDELYYLRSRGIQEKDARAMIIYGFADDLLMNLPVEAIKNKTQEMIYSQLERMVK